MRVVPLPINTTPRDNVLYLSAFASEEYVHYELPARYYVFYNDPIQHSIVFLGHRNTPAYREFSNSGMAMFIDDNSNKHATNQSCKSSSRKELSVKNAYHIQPTPWKMMLKSSF